jgi:CRP/FNR family cyclic AMP-dependent transcriptional regulator
MSGKPDPAILRDIGLFYGLPPDRLSWLAQHLHRKTVRSGTSVMSAEQPGETVYIVLSGCIKIHVEQPNGTNVTLAILGPGDVIGEMSLLDGTGRSADVLALENTTLLWMDRDAFEECLRNMPGVTANMMRILCNRLRYAGQQIQALASMDVQGRVARQILDFAQRYGDVTPDGDVLIPIRLTQSDLASLVGASRERVNKILAIAKRNGHLSVDRDYHITVHNHQALARQCQFPLPLPRTPALTASAYVTNFTLQV